MKAEIKERQLFWMGVRVLSGCLSSVSNWNYYKCATMYKSKVFPLYTFAFMLSFMYLIIMNAIIQWHSIFFQTPKDLSN